MQYDGKLNMGVSSAHALVYEDLRNYPRIMNALKEFATSLEIW